MPFAWKERMPSILRCHIQKEKAGVLYRERVACTARKAACMSAANAGKHTTMTGYLLDIMLKLFVTSFWVFILRFVILLCYLWETVSFGESRE